MSSGEGTSKIPLLGEKHSGIPANLLAKAQKAKALIYGTRTESTNTRQRSVVIPQGIEKTRFLAALDELGGLLGQENVEVNDKPLVDGWYMERVYRGHSEINFTDCFKIPTLTI
jgi:hypothetical protein